ncbi:helix-turn-helix domain-containing protein, partial [Streptomyces rubiginosohelvolus]|uniref:helix-turn-helix domain-containing protein n=1 Tax=Streptomyces rubiginosohelvolus TaxID=67362 RepID=UPI003F4C4144
MIGLLVVGVDGHEAHRLFDPAGIPKGSGARRVPGLRREEGAILSGVSVDYYTRIEKGDLTGVSDEVLDALA